MTFVRYNLLQMIVLSALCALKPSLYFGTEHGRVLRTVLVVDDHLTEDTIDKNEQVFFSALCWVPSGVASRSFKASQRTTC